MNVMSLMATLGIDSKAYDKGLGNAVSHAHSAASTIAKALGGIAIGVGAFKTFQSIINLTKQAVSAFAEYEQLVGGVETLFGNGGKSFEQFAASASNGMYKMGQRGEDVKKLQEEINALLGDGEKLAVDGIYGPKTQAALEKYASELGSVQKAYDDSNAAAEKMTDNAWTAFDRVGVDANTYMNTVTSFSASLMQSLGGDTDKAVELADQAMIDMADNANKMGTPIDSIMVAYQGFAKQNYTMLDNLKLGGQRFSRAA